MTASTTIVTLTKGSDSVDIMFTKIEHDYDTQISILSVPKSLDKVNTCPVSTSVKNPLNLSIDILRLKQAITITGILLEESSSSALAKKDVLEKILSGGENNKGGLCSLSWLVGTTTITKYGSIIKCKISESPGRVGFYTNTQGKMFDITLQFGVGTVKTG